VGAEFAEEHLRLRAFLRERVCPAQGRLRGIPSQPNVGRANQSGDLEGGSHRKAVTRLLHGGSQRFLTFLVILALQKQATHAAQQEGIGLERLAVVAQFAPVVDGQIRLAVTQFLADDAQH
jgi:hypothetical protein